eukprot:750480-Hanusia_phi.AAC.9
MAVKHGTLRYEAACSFYARFSLRRDKGSQGGEEQVAIADSNLSSSMLPRRVASLFPSELVDSELAS